MAEVAEVVPFLDDSRAEVREMAVQGIASHTATPEGTAALCRCDGLYPRLVSLLARAGEPGCSEGAAAAMAALVNLSQQPAERLKLLDTAGAVSATAACVSIDEPAELAEYASMLLTNLTQLPRGVELLVEAGGEKGATLAGLVPRLAAAPKAGESSARLAHLALVLTSAVAHAGAQQIVLEALGGGKGAVAESPILDALCEQMASEDETRRLGCVRTLRNLCFAAKPGEETASTRALLLGPAVLPVLVRRLAARLAVKHANYTEDERSNFGPELKRDDAPERVPSEAAAETRILLTEALLLLSADKAARQAMRDLAIYPIVREAHLAEPDTEAGARIRVANEQLVELFYLSAEAVGDAPSEGAGAGAAEASKSKEVDEEEEPRVEEVD